MKHKVAFVDFSVNFWDKHPIYSLSSYLKSKGIDVFYIKENSFKKSLDRINEVSPDTLLYSAYNSDIPTFVEFDRFVKKDLKINSIIGGPGPTYNWKASSNSTIDAFCVGEGEYALGEYILNGYKSGENIFLNGEDGPKRFAPFVDLDSLPFPDREIVYKRDKVIKKIETKWFLSGRGCPYNCTYCFNNAFNKMFKVCGNIIRKKSVDYLTAEILDVKSKYPLKNIVFQDDTFITDKKWLFEFSEKFREKVNIPYTCNVRASLLNEEIVIALKNSGCRAVMWSIESGNDYIRKKILKRNESREQIIKAGELLNMYKIPFRIANIIGLPGEKFSEMLETVELNILAKPTYAHASIYAPFPSLELTDYALKNNYLSAEKLNNLPKNMFMYSVLNISDAENQKIQKLLFLFPFLVNFPHLLFKVKIFNFLMKIPKKILFFFYEIYNLYKQWRIYAGKISFRSIILILFRYLSNRQCS